MWRRLYPFLIGFLLILLIAIILERPWKSAQKENKTLGINPERVSIIEIREKENHLRLVREDGNWFVEKEGKRARADSSAVERALSNIGDLRGDVISKNPQKYELFEVTEDKSTILTFLSSEGETLLVLYVGKKGPDYSSNYVRRGGSEEVYLIGSYIKPQFHTDFRRWRNKRVLYFDEKSAYYLELISKKDTLIFTRADTGWVCESFEEPLDTLKVVQALRSLSRLYSYDFADTVSLEDAGLKDPPFIVKVELTDGTQYLLKVGNLQDTKYYVQREGDETIYLVSKYSVERFKKTREEFIKKEEKKEKKES
jgi:hypothetical protein